MLQNGENPVDRSQVSTSPPSALAENELHIWRVDVRDCFPGLQSAHQLLSTGERERAQRFIRFRDRSRFIIARAALRCILSRYEPVGPECLVFEIGQWGKPRLHSSARSMTNFNLSHSGDIAVVAIASGCDVGVDVEQVRAIADEASIVERFLSESDRAVYHAAPASNRNALFFHLWTRHEAMIKATGEGLAAHAVHPSNSRDTIQAGTSERFVPMSGYVGSVAASREVGRVQFLDFTRIHAKFEQ